MAKFVLKKGRGKTEKPITHVQSIVLSNYTLFVLHKNKALRNFTHTLRDNAHTFNEVSVSDH